MCSCSETGGISDDNDENDGEEKVRRWMLMNGKGKSLAIYGADSAHFLCSGLCW